MASSGYELYSEDLALDKELSPEIVHREAIVTNQGHLSTSFQVPGFISVPTDGEVHTVTVVELKLDAAMAWIGIPKAQPKIQIKVRLSHISLDASILTIPDGIGQDKERLQLPTAPGDCQCLCRR